MSEVYCPPPPKGIGEYTTEELQQELASRDQFLGDFSMEVGGQRFVDHVKEAIKNECGYRGIPMLDDIQIGVVITSLRNHSYTVLMTRYDRRERFDLDKVTDFYPIESSVGRFLRDAGNELIDRHENHIRHMSEMVQEGGSDTDVTTKAESDTAERDTKLWYIVTEFGGDVVMGGFETKDLALEVRQMVENQAINKAFNKTYAIEQRQALEKVMGGK